MKVGFIGAGKAGCSLGKYFSMQDIPDIQVTGYYSLFEEEAKWAAEFTDSAAFQSAEDVIAASDTIVLSTPDGAVKDVWESLKKDNIGGRIFCHLSGSLSSDVFSGIETYGAYPVSVHPLFAFSDKESVYQQLHKVRFTLEGHSRAVSAWESVLEAMGNPAIEITREVKPKYHAAASLLSNHVVAVLAAGYELLEECGFSEEEARDFSEALVLDNVGHIIRQGAVAALTGPIERGDEQTVQKHLSVLSGANRIMYLACSAKLLELAKKKNPDRDYTKLEDVLEEQNEKYSTDI